ncbi:YqiA/YcfP family alpha/beta fold hydrolase [Psychrobacter arenosus]|uniref:YqiA/YcfP family alpha/beta fold hydrolase n=1 Tax=Psychrobacter arenosus TaxID=256326 RepID=UPI00191B1188|nr:YqiA/YcfP family alpha/beta fold hydrolase [Psychrobacter arenosus]
MKIIYIHGLDSSANSMKGLLLEAYCAVHHPNIEVIRPDLNLPPAAVFKLLCELVSEKEPTSSTLLMGSSLGGYFTTLVSNHTGCPAVLLNPSTQPHISLQRFLQDQPEDIDSDTVIYQSSGGWEITPAHLAWFAEHQLTAVCHPEKMLAWIKAGDELLNPEVATEFYRQQGVEVILQEGGDHRMTDFAELLPILLPKALDLPA